VLLTCCAIRDRLFFVVTCLQQCTAEQQSGQGFSDVGLILEVSDLYLTVNQVSFAEKICTGCIHTGG
jgi:hypothetical protein